jgi:hypothetical protein
LASANNVVASTIPYYINFPIPSHTASYRSNGYYPGWIYKTVSGTNQTSSSYYQFFPLVIGNYLGVSEFPIDGSWKFILDSADNVCHIEKEVFSAQYRMVIGILSGSTFTIRIISLTTLLTGATITDQAKWFVSPDC